jgi:hypothetical protein
MKKQQLTEVEQAVANDLLSWVKSFEVVHVAPSRKLIKIISPQDEEQYYSLVSDPEPHLIFQGRYISL